VIAKLPRWAWIGGALLTCIAGMINTVGLLGFRHQPITHLTGTTTLFGTAAARGDIAEMMHWGLVIVAFLAGAVLSGFIVRQQTLKLGRRYGVALIVESLLLFVAVPLIHGEHDLGLYLASMACGLQNAMTSTFSGAVLRTTHLSGIFTDLGIWLGQRIRGMEVDVLRIRLSLMLIGGFLLGSILGGLAFPLLQERTLLIPAILTGLTGIIYMVYRHRAWHRPDVERKTPP
jgi:uncharacterized membrane protein YoaK (UPF0700 family)